MNNVNFSKMSVNNIKNYLEHVREEEVKEIISVIFKDDRKSVQKLAITYLNRLKKLEREKYRIKKLREFDRNFAITDDTLIAGVDEAGRGPLAGPVFSCAVILRPDTNILGINDSKKLSEQKREQLYDEIIKNCFCYSIKYSDCDEIDSINIRNATFKSMVRAVNSLEKTPHYVLIDGDSIKDLKYPHSTIVGGDAKSFSIAAASILAKVSRDRYIKKMHHLYPQYNFESNKGYGTKEHIEAIKKYGPSPLHRKSFLTNIL